MFAASFEIEYLLQVCLSPSLVAGEPAHGLAKIMKIDVIDVFKNACESLFGRIFIVVLVVNIFGTLGLMMHADEASDVWDFLIMAIPSLLFTLLGGIGLITLPLLLAFTIFYARFELHYAYLIIPAVLSFFTLYKPFL